MARLLSLSRLENHAVGVSNPSGAFNLAVPDLAKAPEVAGTLPIRLNSPTETVLLRI